MLYLPPRFSIEALAEQKKLKYYPTNLHPPIGRSDGVAEVDGISYPGRVTPETYLQNINTSGVMLLQCLLTILSMH